MARPDPRRYRSSKATRSPSRELWTDGIRYKLSLASDSRDSKISALEAKLQAMEAERAASASASEAEGEPVVKTSASASASPGIEGSGLATLQTAPSGSKPIPSLPPAGLPRKPTADTIAKGAAALEAKEAGIKLPPSKEPAKTTLASLGTSMGRQ